MESVVDQTMEATSIRKITVTLIPIQHHTRKKEINNFGKKTLGDI